MDKFYQPTNKISRQQVKRSTSPQIIKQKVTRNQTQKGLISTNQSQRSQNQKVTTGRGREVVQRYDHKIKAMVKVSTKQKGHRSTGHKRKKPSGKRINKSKVFLPKAETKPKKIWYKPRPVRSINNER